MYIYIYIYLLNTLFTYLLLIYLTLLKNGIYLKRGTFFSWTIDSNTGIRVGRFLADILNPNRKLQNLFLLLQKFVERERENSISGSNSVFFAG